MLTVASSRSGVKFFQARQTDIITIAACRVAQQLRSRTVFVRFGHVSVRCELLTRQTDVLAVVGLAPGNSEEMKQRIKDGALNAFHQASEERTVMEWTP